MQDTTIDIMLQEAREGSIKAFEALQDHFTPSIQRFVQRMINDGADVDDIVQQTFIALYMNLDQIDPPAKLKPFLFRVARNLSYDNLRKWYRRDELALDDCEYRLRSNSISPEDLAHWRGMLDDVRAAIDCLPDIHRDTLILYVEEGFTQVEIADVMHTEVGTVKSRLHYARKLLRQMVSPDILMALANK